MVNPKRHVARLLVFLVAFPLCGALLVGLADPEEQSVKLGDVPEAIQKALAGLDADDLEIELVTHGDRRVYEVEFEVEDAEVELTLTEDGTLLSVEIEEESDSDDD